MNRVEIKSLTSENPIKKTFHFRIYAGLNDFLPANLRQRTFTLAFKTPITVSEVIESIGIPLSEVALVLVNSEPADFSSQLQEYDFLSIYPAFETLNISEISKIKQVIIKNPRFILDAHLGKLAKYLRMLGFDTLYHNDFGDNEIIEIAAKDNRIILSRDKLLLKSKSTSPGYYVRATEKHEQLKEIVMKFNLYDQFKSFTRCMTCNTELVPRSREEVTGMVNEDTLQIFNEFFYCPVCDKVFWKGSHFERMENLILNISKQ